MTKPAPGVHRRSWGRVIGRFGIALVCIMFSGSMTNAGISGDLPALFALFALALLIWAFLGLRRTR